MKKPIDLDAFKAKLQKNCDISDVNGASIFSICGMALRLRDLNKWADHLEPWQENDPQKLVDWIDAKEQLWESLQDKPFERLPLCGTEYDPFDTVTINTVLMPHGLFYGAGYAHSMKPTFFLAKIKDRYQIEKTRVILLGKEFTRDLLTIPALNQDDAIIVRKESARLFFWDQMAYLKKSGHPYLHYALKQCGLSDTGVTSRKKNFETLLAQQMDTFIYHERGEIMDTTFDRNLFRQIVSRHPHTTVELITRTTKDLLADTGPFGTLQRVIETQNAAALGFYLAFQDGLFKPLFPELRQTFDQIGDRDIDWNDIAAAKEKGYQTAKTYTRLITGLYRNEKPSRLVEKINNELVQPLIDQGVS